MRYPHSPFLAFLLLLAFAGCAGENAAEKSSRQNAIGNRQEISLKLAHATESAGDLTAAEKLYLRVIAAHPSSLQPHIELAEFYRRHNNTTQAITAYNEALRLDPANITLLRDIANTYINSGQTGRAVATLDKAIAINSKDPLLYNSKGVALDMEGHYALAQQSYRSALALDPDDAMMFDANLSMSYILSGQYGEAINVLRPLLNDPRATPTIRQNLAMAYGMKGEKENALALGLKDLTPEQAAENLKFYGMVAHAHPASGTQPQSSAAVRAAIRDVFPQDDADSPAPAIMAAAPAAHTIPTPAYIQSAPSGGSSLPIPALRGNMGEQNALPAASGNNAAQAPAASPLLPLPALRPE